MNEQLVAILHKSINGASLTDSEERQLEEWIGQSDHNRHLYDELMNTDVFRQDVRKMLSYDSRTLLNKLNRQLYPSDHKSNIRSIFRRHSFWYAAAAVLTIVVITAIKFLPVDRSSISDKSVSVNRSTQITDISPGIEKATLTLDNGTNLVLDNTGNGKIAEQGNTIIEKKDGQLAYNAGSKAPSQQVFYNTLTVPRAGYYSSLMLADGSKVWLNSESSIRFPTSFTGKERSVDVTGEVYFEVAKNPAKPFKVNVKDKGMTVEVLGTHFTINAYNDEASVKTTLLEGAVKVVADGKASFLKPGQQSELNANREIKILNDADIEQAVAWKKGMFFFRKEDLATIMRQVSRWYGVEVVFEEKIPGHFVATVPRDVPVSKLLKIFEAAGGVKFEIDEVHQKIKVRR